MTSSFGNNGKVILIASLFALGWVKPGFSQDLNNDGWLSVLIPLVATENPGRNGSSWSTEHWLYNGSSSSVQGFIPEATCGIPGSCEPLYPPGYMGPLGLGATNSLSGELLYLYAADPASRAISERLHFESRVYESSRGSQAVGVELPVVREPEFLVNQAALVAIPVDSRVRSTLRVYDPFRTPGSAVLVEYLDTDEQVVHSETLQLTDASEVERKYPRVPGFNSVHNVTSRFPALASLAHYTIRMTPLGDTKFWAFVSVTDNESQHVLLVTPD